MKLTITEQENLIESKINHYLITKIDNTTIEIHSKHSIPSQRIRICSDYFTLSSQEIDCGDHIEEGLRNEQIDFSSFEEADRILSELIQETIYS